MKQDKARLGRAIRKARETMSPPLTREQLAEVAHIRPRRLGDFETGRWDGVRPVNRDAIERALGWKPGSWDQILAGGDPIPVDHEPVQRRRVEDREDLVYVVTNAEDLSPDALHTVRLVMEKAIQRSHEEHSQNE